MVDAPDPVFNKPLGASGSVVVISLKPFTMGSFYGGRLLLRAIEPFRPGDTVTFQGELTSLSEITTTDAGGSQRLVECRIRGINQREDLVNLSEATLVLIGLAADK